MRPTADWNFAGRLVRRLGSHSCLIDAAARRTIGPEDLPRRIEAYGASLISAGLKKGDRVLIGCSLSPSSTLAYLGAIYAGLVAAPVEDRQVTTSAATLVKATGAKAVWSEAGLRNEEFTKSTFLCLHGDLAKEKGKIPPAACLSSDPAALMATSGSMGAPRFVLVNHGNLIANTEAIIRSQRLASDERAMLVLPVSYVFGASVMHTHLYQGGGVVFDHRFMFPDKVLQAIAHFGCTTFAGVPTVYNVLIQRSNIRRIPMPSLRRFLQAGGPMASEKISEMRALFLQAKFYVMYGQTEATARISCMEPERWEEKPGSVGRPLDNLDVLIVDEQGNPLPTGQVGELMVRGPSVCSGYFNDSEETRRVFCDGWLRTRDLARQDEEGYLWIEGRKGTFLKMRGIRVSIAEIEERVNEIRGVSECAACAVDHPEAGEAVALFIEPDQTAKIVVGRSSPPPSSPLGHQLDPLCFRIAEDFQRKNSALLAFSGVDVTMQQLDDKIDRVLSAPPYRQSPDERQAGLLELLKEELTYACQRHGGYRNYIQHWPSDYRSARQVSDLPFLPVGVLKANPPLSLISHDQIKRTLTSSATTSQVAQQGCTRPADRAAHDQRRRDHCAGFHRPGPQALPRCGHSDAHGRRRRIGGERRGDLGFAPLRQGDNLLHVP